MLSVITFKQVRQAAKFIKTFLQLGYHKAQCHYIQVRASSIYKKLGMEFYLNFVKFLVT